MEYKVRVDDTVETLMKKILKGKDLDIDIFDLKQNGTSLQNNGQFNFENNTFLIMSEKKTVTLSF